MVGCSFKLVLQGHHSLCNIQLESHAGWIFRFYNLHLLITEQCKIGRDLWKPTNLNLLQAGPN